MTQTPAHKPSTGAAAAPAAVTPSGAKPTDNKPADKPADKPSDKPADGQAAAGKKPRESKRKVFIVVGEVREFDSILQAEKHLNSPEAPVGDFAVLQGVRTKTSKKVSLR